VLGLNAGDQIAFRVEGQQRAKKPAKKSRADQGSANVEVLAALHELMFGTIPGDPSRSEYRQADTLGANRKHWFRAKFGGQRFRLFFRYDSRAKVIVYAWVNDKHSESNEPRARSRAWLRRWS
jgi:toxin YhaV